MIAPVELIEKLRAQGATVAVAESCTGGRLAAALTAAAGASEYFLGGVVAYSNDVKINVLGVDKAAIERHGAVSRQVAEQMAIGVQRLTGSDFAIATTGIAGPGGGTPEKPVGTVWIAVAGPSGEVSAQVAGPFSGAGEKVAGPCGAVSSAVAGANSVHNSAQGAGEKPVHSGEVSALIAQQNSAHPQLTAQLFHFTGAREQIMASAVQEALKMLQAAM